MAQAHLSEDLKKELREEKKEARKYLLVWPVVGFVAIGMIAVFWKIYYKPLNQIEVQPTQEVSYPPNSNGAGNAGTPTPAVSPTTKPTVTPAATPKPTPVASISKTHAVAEGDTLWSIADEYGVDVSAIQKANNLTDDSVLQIGQKITIPN